MQFLPSTWARWARRHPGPARRDHGRSPLPRPRRRRTAGPLDEALFRYNNSTHYVRGVTRLAQVIERRPRAFYGYYHWDIYYLTAGATSAAGGYSRDRPVPVERWLATHRSGRAPPLT